jgi:hypothetical protein
VGFEAQFGRLGEEIVVAVAIAERDTGCQGLVYIWDADLAGALSVHSAQIAVGLERLRTSGRLAWTTPEGKKAKIFRVCVWDDV